MKAEVDEKIRMLQNSLACFTCGLLALLPVVGFGFGFAALVVSAKARVGERRFWNAGHYHRIIGVTSALIGIFFWVFIIALILWHRANALPE